MDAAREESLARVRAAPELAGFAWGEVLDADAGGWLVAARAANGADARVRVFRDVLGAETLARWRGAMTQRVNVTHPALERVLAFGDAGGRAFVALAAVRGSSLVEERGGKTLAPAAALSVVYRVLGALGEVHALGLVHGGLSARAVVVDGAGKVHLTEAGIAWPLGGAGAYAAPEQRGGVATAHSDLYAAGLILHELLTGTLPQRVAAGEAAAPAAPDSVMLPPYIGMALARVLAARPEARPQTAAETMDLLVPPGAKAGWGEAGVFAPPVTRDELLGHTKALESLVGGLALGATLVLLLVVMALVAVAFGMSSQN